MKKKHLFPLFVLAFSDLMLVNCALILGLLLTNKLMVAINPALYYDNIFSCTLIWLFSSGIFKVYRYQTLQNYKRMYTATLKSAALFAVVFIGYLYLTRQESFPLEALAILLPVFALAFMLSRITAFSIKAQLPANIRTGRNVSDSNLKI